MDQLQRTNARYVHANQVAEMDRIEASERYKNKKVQRDRVIDVVGKRDGRTMTYRRPNRREQLLGHKRLSNMVDEIIEQKVANTENNIDGTCMALCKNGEQCSRNTKDGQHMCTQHIRSIYKKVDQMYDRLCESEGIDPLDLATVSEKVDACIRCTGDAIAPVFVWDDTYDDSKHDVNGCPHGYTHNMNGSSAGCCVPDKTMLKNADKLYNKIVKNRSIDVDIENDILYLLANPDLPVSKGQNLAVVYFTYKFSMSREKGSKFMKMINGVLDTWRQQVDVRTSVGAISIIFEGLIDSFQYRILRRYAAYKMRPNDIKAIVSSESMSKLQKVKRAGLDQIARFMHELMQHDTLMGILMRFLQACLEPVSKIVMRIGVKLASFSMNKFFTNYIANEIDEDVEDARALVEQRVVDWVDDPKVYKVLMVRFAFELEMITEPMEMQLYTSLLWQEGLIESVMKYIPVVGAVRDFFKVIISDAFAGAVGYLREFVLNKTSDAAHACMFRNYFVYSIQRVAFVSGIARGFHSCSRQSMSFVKSAVRSQFQEAIEERVRRNSRVDRGVDEIFDTNLFNRDEDDEDTYADSDKYMQKLDETFE